MPKREQMDLSVLVLTHDVSEHSLDAHRIDQAMLAVGHLERALVRWGLTNLDLMRRSGAWRRACALPTGLNSKGEIVDKEARATRNTGLDACRKKFSLTEYTFAAKILEFRRESKWICEHVPSSVALSHAKGVYESFAAHLFRHAGRPRWRSPGAVNVLIGGSRDKGRGPATAAEIERAVASGKNPPQARGGAWAGLSVRGTYPDSLSVHLHPSGEVDRHLVLPVRLRHDEREAHYLGDPDSWIQAKLVRRIVKTKTIYELHLVCEKPVWRPVGCYDNVPAARVGVYLGTSTLAAVGVDETGTITAAMLVRPSEEERAYAKEAAARLRRQHRAQDRSRRANNPGAYGPDKHGRPGRGPLKRGARLTTSANYRRRRSAMADESRRATAGKVGAANHVARKVVTTCGADIITEDVRLRAWQMTWGGSHLRFAPWDFFARVEREAKLAKGSVTMVPCALALTQMCHCGAKEYKPLSERQHRCIVCGCGYSADGMPLPTVDRDIHSAYLAAFVVASPIQTTDPASPSTTSTSTTRAVHTAAGNTQILDVTRANVSWAGAEALLVAASGHPIPRGTGSISRQSFDTVRDDSLAVGKDGTGSRTSAPSEATSLAPCAGSGNIDLVGSDTVNGDSPAAEVDHEKTHAGTDWDNPQISEPAPRQSIHRRSRSARPPGRTASPLRLDG
jgi:hypothetical protein